METTPKQKAKQLVDRFDSEVRCLDNEVSHTKDESIQCALICVNELLSTVPYINNTVSDVKKRMYYMNVRTELNNLK